MAPVLLVEKHRVDRLAIEVVFPTRREADNAQVVAPHFARHQVRLRRELSELEQRISLRLDALRTNARL